MISELAAQIPPEASWFTTLTATGALSFFLHYMMGKNERRMLGMERSLDRSIRACMVMTVAFRQVSDALKDEAKIIISEIENEEKKRGE